MSIRPRPEGGTLVVEEDSATRTTLTESAVLELTALGQRVAALFDAPQDIEWARAAESFFLLQARPITSLFPLPAGLPTDGFRVLPSVGAFQGMLEPFTPLGADAFSGALSRVLALIGGGLSQDGTRRLVIAGERLFLDVTPMLERPRTRALLRGALRAVEPATGEALDQVLDALTPESVKRRRGLPAPSVALLAALTRALGNVGYNMVWPDRGRARVQRRLAKAIQQFEQRAAAARRLTERLALLDAIFGALPRLLMPVLLPGFGTGLANFRLIHRLATHLPDGDRRVLELTRGLPHNVTTEMDLALWDVARTIRSDASAAALFRTADPSTLATESISRRLPPVAQVAIDAFLRQYGMRGVGEIDFGRPRWRDDPTPLMQVLQSYLRIENAEQAPDAVFRRGAEAAERTLASLIGDARHTRSGRVKAFVMKRAARRMRALGGLRESPKFTIVTMLGIVRDALRASGAELVASGVLDSPDDIFFL